MRARLAVLLLAFPVSARECLADKVLLQRGQTIEGKILRESSGQVVIDTQLHGVRATLTLQRADIRSVTRCELPAGFFEGETRPKGPPPPATQAVSPSGALKGSSAPPVPASGAAAPKASEILANQVNLAERGDRTAMRWLVAAYETGQPIPANEHLRRKWLRRLCESGYDDDSLAEHLTLALEDPIGYARLCRPAKLTSAGVSPPSVGKPIEVTGIVRKETGAGWVLRPLERGNPGGLQAEWFGMPEPEGLEVGRAVTLRGALGPDGVLNALQGEVPKPAFKYKFRVLDHGAAAGQAQNWVVGLEVTNTGKQRIRSIDFDVALYQTQSPNKGDLPERVTVTDLLPGESQTKDVTFSLYNFQYLGATSIPKASVVARDPEW